MVYLPHWPVPSSLGKRAIDYETVFERMAVVLKRLGNPEKKLPPIIHVAGTNGKGSCASLITKILQVSGYKTQLYTSPHLLEANERILLDGQKISDSELFSMMEEVRINSEDVMLTFMESFTIGAFLAFSRNPADVLVLECGMGGRIDATNIVEEKIATVITSISFDHEEYLGNSLAKIAFEKSMIFRQKTPLIVAAQAQEALEVIKLIAFDQSLPAIFYGEDFFVAIDEKSGEFDFVLKDQISLQDLPKPSLPGNHQYLNFACAIAAVLCIQNHFTTPYAAIAKAVSLVEWKNRLERLKPQFDKIFMNHESEIWIDGAHNEGGAEVLANWLANENKKSPKENFVICGFSRGKCRLSFLEKFIGIAEIYAVRVNGEPYPESSETIAEIAKNNDIKVQAFADLDEAIFSIAKKYKTTPCRIVICGSLHLARDVKNSEFLK